MKLVEFKNRDPEDIELGVECPLDATTPKMIHELLAKANRLQGKADWMHEKAVRMQKKAYKLREVATRLQEMAGITFGYANGRVVAE